MIDKETVAKLHRLYERRADLQRSREDAANRNFWLAIVNGAFDGNGTRSSVMNALGGSGDLADALSIAVSNRFEVLQKELDKQIADLGGSP